MTALKSFVDDLATVFHRDSWQNLLTGVGYALRDKVKSTMFAPSARIDPTTLENMYHEDDLISVLCDTVPEEMLRRGFNVDISDDDEEGREREWEEECATFADRMEITTKFTNAGVWARLFGGAALFPIVDDGLARDELTEPLDITKIRTIKGLNVIEGRYLQPDSWYDDPTEEKYGEPQTWRITPYSSGASIGTGYLLVHESRLILFHGTRSSVARKQRNQGFSESLVQKTYATIQMYANTWMSVGNLMSDANQAVFKIKNLMHMIATEDQSLINNRMQLVDMCRSVARAIVIDADGEEFERHSTSFAGLDSILQMFVLRLSSSFRMPATILMGQSPAGQNATGDADFRWFYDRIESAQSNELAPKLRRLFEIAFAAKNGPTGGIVPTKWSIVFRPLQRMTEKEEGEIRNTQANTDNVYIQSGVVLPEEVTLSRFTRDGWNAETNEDLELREKMLELEAANEIRKAENPPSFPIQVIPENVEPEPEPEPKVK